MKAAAFCGGLEFAGNPDKGHLDRGSFWGTMRQIRGEACLVNGKVI